MARMKRLLDKLKDVKNNYTETVPYDLAMSLLLDKLTDDLYELAFLVNNKLQSNNNYEVAEAYNDYTR